MAGSEQEAIDFLNWFCDLPYEHNIFICGNHDDCLYRANIDGLPDNVHQFCNSDVEIDGVKFYGVHVFMGNCIINVLITHSPACGILDYDDNINYGYEGLLNEISKIKPRFIFWGAVHFQANAICGHDCKKNSGRNANHGGSPGAIL